MKRLRAIRPLEWVFAYWRNISAPGLFVSSFVLLIALGTAGLMWLPGLYTGERLRFVDALFTITSATCVTGLSVVDTASYFTFWGQAWILLFIQLGGLGLVSLSSLIIGMLGRRLSLRSEMITAPPTELTATRDLRGVVIAVAKFTFAIEAVGALALWLAFARHVGPIRAVWPAIFHAVSAFCNAGFSTFTGNMTVFSGDPAVLIFVSLLIVIGGFGYLSSEELLRWWRARDQPGRRRLSTHTWAAAVTTLALLGAGFLLFLLFEWDGVLQDLAFVDKLVNAWFMSVTPRTAGFNSVPYEAVGNDTAYLTILLMVVGGSPGSTAGGIKTTAFAVLVALAFQRMRGRRNAVIHHRSIPDGTVERTVSLALLAFAVMTAAIFWLNFTETGNADVEPARASFLPLFFEVVSAFATAGLTMDETRWLTDLGKLTIVALMFVGRVGPLSFFAAISFRSRGAVRDVRPAREDLIVG